MDFLYTLSRLSQGYDNIMTTLAMVMTIWYYYIILGLYNVYVVMVMHTCHGINGCVDAPVSFPSCHPEIVWPLLFVGLAKDKPIL